MLKEFYEQLQKLAAKGNKSDCPSIRLSVFGDGSGRIEKANLHGAEFLIAFKNLEDLTAKLKLLTADKEINKAVTAIGL